MDKKIALIGLGNMGYSIAAGLSKEISGDITGFDNYPPALDKFKNLSVSSKARIICSASESEAAEKSDIVILALKPDIILKSVEMIKNKLSGKLIISIAAGIKISQIEEILSQQAQIIRVMPNTPALISEAMSVLCPNSAVIPDNIEIATGIFKSIGKTLILPEKHIDAVTAVSGCGPAYVFTFIQALADAGVELGLSRSDSVLLASQTIAGAARMVMDSGDEPISLRNKVTSPGGSTIVGIHVMERAGFSGIVIDAAVKACEKSRQLGQK